MSLEVQLRNLAGRVGQEIKLVKAAVGEVRSAAAAAQSKADAAAVAGHGHALTDANITGTLPDAQLRDGLRSVSRTLTDWDEARQNGWWMGSSALNAPEASGWFMGDVVVHNDNYVTQTVHRFTDDVPTDSRTYRRSRTNGSWSPWYRIRWAEAELDVRYAQVGHTHDDRYYTEAEADARFTNPGAIFAALGMYVATHYGVVGDGTANDTAPLRALVALAPAGSTIVIPDTLRPRVTQPISVPKPLTFTGGDWVANLTGETFLVEADNIRFENMQFTGPGSWSSSTLDRHIFIATPLGSTTRRTGIRIRNVVMTKCLGTAIRLEYASDFRIEDVRVEDTQYGGIMLLSARSGHILRNVVRNVVMGGTYVNSYGIAVTDSANTEEGRSRDVWIEQNLVDGVPGWEGIDTHSGRHITIRGNIVRNCRTGIALLPGNSARLLAPEDCVVSENMITRGTGISGGYGITFVGRTDGSLTRVATGYIGTNTIRGYPQDLQVDVYDVQQMVILPQVTDITTSRGPGPMVYRYWSAAGTVTIPAGASGGTAGVIFPAGYFTADPMVRVTKASGVGARFAPYITGKSANGVTVGFYDPTGTGSGASALTLAYEIEVTQGDPRDGRGQSHN